MSAQPPPPSSRPAPGFQAAGRSQARKGGGGGSDLGRRGLGAWGLGGSKAACRGGPARVQPAQARELALDPCARMAPHSWLAEPTPTFLHLETQATPHSHPVSPHPLQKAPSRHVGRGSVSIRQLQDPRASCAQRPEETPPPCKELTPHHSPSPHSEHVEGKCGRQTLSASALNRKPRWDGALHLQPAPGPGSPPEAAGIWMPLCKQAPTPAPAPLFRGQIPSPWTPCPVTPCLQRGDRAPTAGPGLRGSEPCPRASASSRSSPDRGRRAGWPPPLSRLAPRPLTASSPLFYPLAEEYEEEGNRGDPQAPSHPRPPPSSPINRPPPWSLIPTSCTPNSRLFPPLRGGH